MKTERSPAVVRCIWMEDSPRSVRIIQEQARGSRIDVWIPKSQIELSRKEGKSGNGDILFYLEIPEWLAEKEGLDYH